jgi:RHS repeat-associated protein
MQGWVDPKMGSTSVVTDASGGVVGTQGYYPFGETRYSTGALFTDKLYTGQQQNSYIKLYWYGSRWYDPALGRFISPDTITPGGVEGLNRYAYVINNPINYIDPSGHICTDPDSEDYVNIAAKCGGSLSDLYDAAATNPDGVLELVSARYDGDGWDQDNRKKAIARGTIAWGLKLQRTGHGGTWYEAFKNGFGGKGYPIVFQWGHTGNYYEGSECDKITSGGCTTGETGSVYLITFASYENTDSQWRINNVVHELAHLFNVLHGGLPASFAGDYANNRKLLLRDPEWRTNGVTYWQMNDFNDPNYPDVTNAEMWADMAIAWNFNKWNISGIPMIQTAINDLTIEMAKWIP